MSDTPRINALVDLARTLERERDRLQSELNKANADLIVFHAERPMSERQIASLTAERDALLKALRLVVPYWGVAVIPHSERLVIQSAIEAAMKPREAT